MVNKGSWRRCCRQGVGPVRQPYGQEWGGGSLLCFRLWSSFSPINVCCIGRETFEALSGAPDVYSNSFSHSDIIAFDTWASNWGPISKGLHMLKTITTSILFFYARLYKSCVNSSLKMTIVICFRACLVVKVLKKEQMHKFNTSCK